MQSQSRYSLISNGGEVIWKCGNRFLATANQIKCLFAWPTAIWNNKTAVFMKNLSMQADACILFLTNIVIAWRPK
jgi:hypothetical protein